MKKNTLFFYVTISVLIMFFVLEYISGYSLNVFTHVTDSISSLNSKYDSTNIENEPDSKLITDSQLSAEDSALEKALNENSKKNPFTSSSIKDDVLLDVPLITQNPELYNGCEVTSLAMLLSYNNIDISKIELSEKVKKDTTQLKKDSAGNIKIWGDPSIGFVGSISGSSGPGVSVDPGPLVDLSKEYIPTSINLTGSDIDTLKKYLSNERPVVVWIAVNFVPPTFMTWSTLEGKKITSTYDTHTIIIVGYDDENIYYNDPLSNLKNASVSITTFEDIFSLMGSKAMSY